MTAQLCMMNCQACQIAEHLCDRADLLAFRLWNELFGGSLSDFRCDSNACLYNVQAVCEQVDVMLGAAAAPSGRGSYLGSPRSSTS